MNTPKKETEISCAQCGKLACQITPGKLDEEAPANCPTRHWPEILGAALEASLEPANKDFARHAAAQQCEGNGLAGSAPQCRVEECVRFAQKMGYKKLGLAFCSGLRKEAIVLYRVLTHHGFQVASVCCKVGGVDKNTLNEVAPDLQIGGKESYEVMCNPITQAELLNNAKTEFNLVIGLCVGHDSLFLKRSDALCTVVAVKDRALGHNPIAAFHLSGSYCQRVLAQKA